MRIQRAVVGVSLLAVITVGLCGCPWDDEGNNNLNPPPATQPGFIVQTLATTIVGGVAELPVPYPYIHVSGTYDRDIGVAMGSTEPYDRRTGFDGLYLLNDRRLNAYWYASVHWKDVVNGVTVEHCNQYGDQTLHAAITTLGNEVQHICEMVITLGFSPPWWCVDDCGDPGGPAVISVQGPGISSTYGMPVMDVFVNGRPMAHNITATSVSGTTATFPAPTSNYNGSGGALGSGFYVVNILNQNSDGSQSLAGIGYIGIGDGSRAQTTPYGVTAFDDPQWYSSCEQDNWYGTFCSASHWSVPDYAVTLAAPGQVCMDGSCANVGTEPVDVKTYGSGTEQDWYQDDGCEDVGSGEVDCYYEQGGKTPPGYAVVANFGSNSVNIVNLSSMTVAATIPVGINPSAIVLDANQQNAYVANYGSASISQISLSSQSVVQTIAVGPNPSALSLDPSGNSLWVGGADYMSNVNLSTYSVASTTPMEGQVTSVAISAAQNSWLCTTVSTDEGAFEAQDASLSNPSSYNTDVAMSISGTNYEGSGTTTTPPPYLKASTVVTATAGNGIAVTSTPTGFAVIDLVSHTIILQGTTPSPVRGIATNPAQGVAYLTEPESNTITTVPLPVPD